MAVDYVAGKKNSLRTKREKVAWYEAKVAEYTTKAASIKEDVKKEEKLISTIEDHLTKRSLLVQEIESLKIRVAQPIHGGMSVDDIFARLSEIETEIADIDSQVRVLYYGK